MSFLLGVCKGLKAAADKDLAAQNSPASLNRLRQKIIDSGLQNGAAILRDALEDELDAAKNQLMLQQQNHDRRFLPAPSQMLLQDEMDVEHDLIEDREGMDIYEFDENGMIL